MTDTISRIMQIRNGMTTDADAEAIIEREIAALQPHGRSSPGTASALADEIEDSYSGNFVQDILLNEEDRKLIVAALRASQPSTPTGGEEETPEQWSARWRAAKARSSAGIEEAEATPRKPVMWVCLVPGLEPADGEMRIRAWTADHKRMESLRDEGLDMQPLYAGAAQAETGPDLTDPLVVHANMLRGTIAKPTWENIQHLYPEEFEAIGDHIKARDAQLFVAERSNDVAQPSWQPIIERLCKPESGHTIHDVVANYRAIRRDALAISSTPRHRPFCSCKASQRDGQHMAWCPAVTSTEGK